MRKSKLALVLTIVAILGLVFAGSAFADTKMTGKLSVTMGPADVNPKDRVYEEYGYTGCDYSYVFDAYQILYFETGCLNDNGGFDIKIDFTNANPSYPFTFDSDYSLPVKVYAETANGSEGAWFTAQPTVEAANITTTSVTIKVEDLMIPAKYTDITKIVVGDENQDLRVTNTCWADTYCVDMSIITKCGSFKVTDSVVEIKGAPDRISIASIDPAAVQAGDCERCFTLKGNVWDCGDQGVGDMELDITVSPAVENFRVSNIETNANGFFTANIAGKFAPGNYKVKVKAEAGCGVAENEYTLKVNKAMATKLDINVTSADGVEDELRFNKCNDVEICLLDDCGWEAFVGLGNNTKIYFTATQARAGQDPIVAGHFYQECPEETCDCPIESLLNGGQHECDTDRDYNQINYIDVNPQSPSCFTVKMVPLVKGPITITATVNVGGKEIKKVIEVNSYAPTEVMMDLFPLVTDDAKNVRAGWPIAAAIALDRTAGSNYEVSFTINGKPVLVADQLDDNYNGVDYIAPMNYDEFVAAFGVAAGELTKCQEADCEEDYEGIFPYCTDKWYFMLYPCEDLRGDFEVAVKVYDPKTDTVIGTESADFYTVHEVINGQSVSKDYDLNFVSPVELTRYLAPDAWQTFSTPKLLAARCEEPDEFGTFAELLYPIYDEMSEGPFSADEQRLFVIGYQNYEWILMDDCDVVEPLAGYYVRTPQREKGDWNMRNVPFKLDYVFARATYPDLSMPYSYYYPGTSTDSPELEYDEWNSIGVGVAPVLADTLTEQADTSAKALGSLLTNNGSYLVWNPGTKLANVNTAFVSNALGGSTFENTTINPFTPLYNGDVYWVYGDFESYFTANVGLDMIEWMGGNYEPDWYETNGF